MSINGKEQVYKAIDVDRMRPLQSCAIGATVVLGMACIAALAVQYFAGPPAMAIKVGGGTRLVYSISSDTPTTREAVMSTLVNAVVRRIDPSRTKEVWVRPYNERQLEIIIPEVDTLEVEFVKKVISTAGVLQFRIVANNRDHFEIIAIATEMAGDPDLKRSSIVRDASNQEVGLWAQMAREEAKDKTVGPLKLAVSSNDLVRDASTGDLLDWTKKKSTSSHDYDDEITQLQRFLDQEQISEIDVLMATDDSYNVTGNDLGMVSQAFDERLNPCINFHFAGSGIDRFSDLTRDYSPANDGFKRQLGILLDNQLLTAPNIQQTITRSGRITGKFTREEAAFIVNILEAGSLPVVLDKEPIVEEPFPADASALQSMQTALWSGLAVLLLAAPVMTIRWGWLGTAAVLAGFAQFLLPAAMLIMIKASFSVSLVTFLVCLALAVTALNALVCEVVHRANRERQDHARTSPVHVLVPVAIFGIVCLGCCFAGTLIYAVGGPVARNLAIGLIACSLSTIMIHACLWLLPALVTLFGRAAHQMPGTRQDDTLLTHSGLE